ncbi:hypothetical protein H6787_02670 [Candidatus Nomurabacteria bacterium]|nr:hypothetical protein [Candidatus Nomurabacteria bacterium]
MWQRQLGTVFANPVYVSTAIFIAWAVFTFAVLLPNIQLIGVVLFSDTASALEKANFLFSLYGSIGTNFTLVSASSTVVIAILFGINVTLLLYYIRKVRDAVSNLRSTGAAGISGLISGVLGIGCAACGTFVLTSVLALIGAGALVTYLPFKGVEFGFIGIGLLLYSTYSLIRKINSPLVCRIEE